MSPDKSRHTGGRKAAQHNRHPDKLCARCQRPFSWRKKWERDWDRVRYCSDRCRMGKAVEERG